MSEDLRPSIRVIGIGSPAGADNLGLLVVEQLGGRFDQDKVELLALDRPGPGLIQHLRGAASVILVDAVKSGAAPGTLLQLDGHKLDAPTLHPPSSHGFGLAEALSLAARLGELPVRLEFIGLETPDKLAEEDVARVARAVAAAVTVELAGANSSSDQAR